MSVEEWKDESNAIPPGEITLPSKEEIEKRNEIMSGILNTASDLAKKLLEKRKAFKEGSNAEIVFKPFYTVETMDVYFRIIPIKRKLNRYSKRFKRQLCIRYVPPTKNTGV